MALAGLIHNARQLPPLKRPVPKVGSKPAFSTEALRREDLSLNVRVHPHKPSPMNSIQRTLARRTVPR
jgi:hypothetical protein